MWRLFCLLIPFTLLQTPPSEPSKWHIKGTLSEACTCGPPCTCNFGEGPSPHNFCYAIVVYTIKSGSADGVKLDGLDFGAVNAQNGRVLYLDERATPQQRLALEMIARKAIRSAMGADDLGEAGRKSWRDIVYTHFVHEVTDKGNHVEVGDLGGFRANYIFGRDPKHPVVVENNTVWAIPRSIKGKTTYLRYKDSFGSALDFQGTNSNQGDFDYTEKSKL